MRHLALALAALLLAGTASAAAPYALDRSGTLWRAAAEPSGLVLTGERDGSQVVRAEVPFAIGFDGATDTEIQVAVDEVSGKVAVVWERLWVEGVSEIFLAVWHNGEWEQITKLSDDAAAFPRFPTVLATSVTSSAEVPEARGGTSTVTVSEGFLHVAWWEGADTAQGGRLALVSFGDGDEPAALVASKALDDLVPLGLGCTLEGDEGGIQHPTFVSQSAKDRALLLFGSFDSCSLNLLSVTFQLANDEGGPISSKAPGPTVASRKRHMPIFGVTGSYQVPQNFSLDDARVVMGNDLSPVAYRVVGDRLEYVVFQAPSWSAPRSLAVREDLTLDQAIPLVENLAR